MTQIDSLKPMPFEPMHMQKLPLDEGKSLRVEPTAMLACRNVSVKTGTHASIFTLALRYLFGGESFFQNMFTGKPGGGWIALEEEVPGQIANYILQPGTSLIMHRGAFVAADEEVKISTIYGGITGWWKGMGFSKLKATLETGGSGRVFFDTVKGQIKELKITEEDGPVLIDNDNTVAHSGELTVTVKKLGGVVSTLFSGEGTVNEFRGNGSIFVGTGQTEKALNVFESIYNALIPSSTELAMLGGLYIALNSSLVTQLAEKVLKNSICKEAT